ncbi:hypothetical protein GQ53DRAFT_886259 [Thozetella sp. PMI_491]|nr:hypothetical protein GQ53DRAFT_886259 [Thozetella sp. PMI_491]
MHASYFSYSIKRPIPYRWFTPVVVSGGIVLAVLFSLVNLASSGYHLRSIYTNDPNTTLGAQKQWFMEPPFNWGGDLDPKCEPQLLAIGDKLFSTNLGLSYEVTSISRIDETGQTASLPSVQYLNNTLEGCITDSVVVDLHKNDLTLPPYAWWISWSPSSTATATARCTIMSEDAPTNITLQVRYSGAGDGTYSYVVSQNFSDHASLWWGTRLLNVYWSGVMSAMALTALSPYWRRHGVTNPEVKKVSFSPALTEGLFFAKVMHSLVAIDLGNTDAPNLLLHDGDIGYALNPPNDMNRQPRGLLYTENPVSSQNYALIPWPGIPPKGQPDRLRLNDSYDAFKPRMGTLGTNSATLFTQYLCSILEQKNTGTMLLAILIADLVFLQAAWKFLKLVTETMLEREDPGAMVCNGCMRAGNRPVGVGMYNLGNAGFCERDPRGESDADTTRSLIDKEGEHTRPESHHG